MVAIDVRRFDLLPRGAVLPLGAKQTQDLSFALVVGSQQDSGQCGHQPPLGWNWGAQRLGQGAVGEGIPPHSPSSVGSPLKIICLEICKHHGPFSQPRARRERRKLIASPEAGMLKGQSEATSRCDYFFSLC